jgi:hypothetical protein
VMPEGAAPFSEGVGDCSLILCDSASPDVRRIPFPSGVKRPTLVVAWLLPMAEGLIGSTITPCLWTTGDRDDAVAGQCGSESGTKKMAFALETEQLNSRESRKLEQVTEDPCDLPCCTAASIESRDPRRWLRAVSKSRIAEWRHMPGEEL